VDLTPRTVIAQTAGPVSAEEGKRLAQLFACVACHAADESTIAKAGPTWKGLFGKERPVIAGGKPAKVTADDSYVRESILEPTAKIAAGFEKGEYAMPSYAGIVTDSQIQALTLYIKSLR
jgi:mono/diheme cytochrome c family protein